MKIMIALLFTSTGFFLNVEFYNNGKKIDMENISTFDSLQEW
jgi:hypothetical protein